VQKGEVEEAMRQVARFKNDLFQKSLKEGYAQLWEEVKKNFTSLGDELTSPALLLQKSERFRILSSLRKGPFGVEALNEFFARKIWEGKSKREDKVAFPILLTRSDRSLNLFNGESGVLISSTSPYLNPAFTQEDFAIFWDEEGGIRQLPAAILPSFEYAFCLSVHKSQGSEFDEVLLLIPPGTEAFGREVLYTAITRARHNLFINGDDRVIREAIVYSSRKVSGLKERLKIHMMQNEKVLTRQENS
jgi:exodeoxyribonuclease V alpha subunit